jgi:hypothetical protein
MPQTEDLFDANAIAVFEFEGGPCMVQAESACDARPNQADGLYRPAAVRLPEPFGKVD